MTMSECTERPKVASITVTCPVDNPQTVPPDLTVKGIREFGFGDPLVKCVVEHPNGMSYDEGMKAAPGRMWQYPFSSLPATPTSPAQTASLTAYLYDPDGTTLLDYDGPYSIYIASGAPNC
jgi:hypothetical protein